MISAPPRPDGGLQPERTRLAWQRTSISLAVCSVVVARFIAVHDVVLGVLVSILAIGCAAMVGITASRRGRRSTQAFWAGTTMPDGRAFVWMSVLIMVTGAGAVVLIALY